MKAGTAYMPTEVCFKSSFVKETKRTGREGAGREENTAKKHVPSKLSTANENKVIYLSHVQLELSVV